MAAYAALLSLMHTIHQIQNHPLPPISLDQKHLHSLSQNLTFLRTFLERFHSTVEDHELESRIAAAAYAAEDAIESHIADQREDERPFKRTRYVISVDLNQGLQRVIQDMDLIKKQVQEKMGSAQLHKYSPASARPAPMRHNCSIVGFDDTLTEIIDRLTGEPDKLEIFPIVGMGGIGKTTIARCIYDDPLILHRFDILAWVTISREFSRREILQVLCQETKGISKSGSSQMSEDELAESVHQELYGRRYLIVMDDVWSIEAWEAVKLFFPDNKNASRIIITTRLSNLALQLSDSHGFQMKFLDKDSSWELLRDIVFGKQGCSIELEDIGQKIAENCRGLPLSIVVIGGLLRKSNMTRDNWEYTLQNLSSSINLEDEEYCLEILGTSYRQLPVHLKPCFLYMAVFPEDDIIYVSDLIKLWVAEAFLKPTDGKSLEEVARVCFDELIERNLILVHELRWNGKVRLCKIHDLLRDLCLREARKQRFLFVPRQDIPQTIHLDRRICFHGYSDSPQFLESAPLTRSLLVMIKGSKSNEPSPSPGFRLLRVYSRADRSFNDENNLTSVEAVFQHANLRYFSVQVDPPCRFPNSWSVLWNLQTLKVDSAFSFEPITAPPEIWEMPSLRHVMFNGLQLPDPPCGGSGFALENLQTLSVIKDFKCSEEVVKRIPNIRTLKVEYSTDRLYDEGMTHFCISHLGQLQKLESLRLYLSYPVPDSALSRDDLVQSLAFSHSLKKLTLRCTTLYWEELTTATGIGSLPRLEVLKLEFDSCIGPEWETVEGQFCSLKFLTIGCCSDLKCWKTDNTHFPRLEHLVLEHLELLEEIPSCVGDISTLQSITLIACSRSAEDSAQIIKEEQEDYANLDLKVHIG